MAPKEARLSTETPWAPREPAEIADWLQDFPAPWYFAGGWALDLFLGKQTRPHADIEIAIFREDLGLLMETLSGFSFYIAHKGKLTPLTKAADMPEEAHGLWLHDEGSDAWDLEVLLERRRDGRWYYRRDERLSLPADEIGFRTAEGLPVIRPEIQLLYKSQTPRPKDLQDLEATLPHLSPDARAWFEMALEQTGGKD